MDDFDAWARKEEALFQILDSEDPDIVVYVYYVQNDKRITPAIYKCAPFFGLEEFLRDEFGPGAFDLMVRRKRKMIFSYRIRLAPLLNHIARRDIEAEIEKQRRIKRKTGRLSF